MRDRKRKSEMQRDAAKKIRNRKNLCEISQNREANVIFWESPSSGQAFKTEALVWNSSKQQISPKQGCDMHAFIIA